MAKQINEDHFDDLRKRWSWWLLDAKIQLKLLLREVKIDKLLSTL